LNEDEGYRGGGEEDLIQGLGKEEDRKGGTENNWGKPLAETLGTVEGEK
jgi:hypothetical protein